MQKMLTAIALIFTASFNTNWAQAAETGTPMAQDLLQCRKIDEMTARVACYDKIADQLGKMVASGQKVDHALTAEATKKPSSEASGVRERSIGQKFLETFGLKEPEGETILLEVTNIKFGPSKQFMVTTSNGQVWLQSGSLRSKLPRDLPFEITIERGAMGSYFLYATGQSTHYKVKRLK